MATAQLLGTNVEATVEGEVLVLRVRLDQDHGPSSTGKTSVIASTHGAQALAGCAGVIVGVNVNRKAKK